MARFCTECGKEIMEGTTFCTECGTKISENQTPPKPVPAPAAVQPPQAKNPDTVGTGYFFGMMLVYALPLIGLIICLITAFTGKNQSKRNFAKAFLIWLIIGIILAVIVAVLISVLGGMVTDYIEETIGFDINAVQNLGDISNVNENANLSGLENLEDLSELEDMSGLENLEDLQQLQDLLEQFQ